MLQHPSDPNSLKVNVEVGRCSELSEQTYTILQGVRNQIIIWVLLTYFFRVEPHGDSVILKGPHSKKTRLHWRGESL
jgi:hypothetical protein